MNENTSLDLIRMHYICFIKFYNKNLDFSTKIGDLSKYIENCTDKKKKIKQLIKDVYNDTNYLNLIIYLCKLHLKCLFSLAKNRNSDVTNKFYQLRIVEVFARELDLEHEANENSYKFQKYYEVCKNTDKEQKDKIKMDLIIKEKNKEELDKIVNTPDEITEKVVVIEKIEELPVIKPAFNFKNIFKKPVKVEKIEKIEIVEEIKIVTARNPTSRIEEDNKISARIDENCFNQIDDQDDNDNDSDLEDVNLCDIIPKNLKYENKIPKLELPQTLSEIGLGGGNQNIDNNNTKIAKNPFIFNKKPVL